MGEERASAGHFKTTPSTTLHAADKHRRPMLTRRPRVFGEGLAGGGRPPLHASSFHSADNTDDDVVTKKKVWIVGALYPCRGPFLNFINRNSGGSSSNRNLISGMSILAGLFVRETGLTRKRPEPCRLVFFGLDSGFWLYKAID